MRLPGFVLLLMAATVPRATAQVAAGVLIGTVVDSVTLAPIQDVLAYVDGRNLAGTTDSTGVFRLSHLAAGAHGLFLTKAGYSPQLFRFTVPDTLAGQLDLPLIGLVRGPPPTPIVSGTVVDAKTDEPLTLANVRLNGRAVGTTGTDGLFRIADVRARWGVNSIQVRRMGYSPMDAELWIPREGIELDLDVALTPAAVRLSEVVVEGDRTVIAYGRARGFYRRRQIGFGHFLTREDVTRWRPALVTDLFRRVPGAWVSPSGLGGVAVRFSRRGAFSCSPHVYLDGARISSSLSDDIDMMVWPDQILGIEVYVGPAQIPPQFNMTGAACGVVVIWTQ